MNCPGIYRKGRRLKILLLSLLLLCTCIDPFTPGLKGYESLLVVDARVTDQAPGCTVILSRTSGRQDTEVPRISDATVSLTGDEGLNFQLVSRGNGIYLPPDSTFRGVTGRKYILHITTSEGRQYESDPAQLLAPSDLDSVSFGRSTELGTNGKPSREGITIYATPSGEAADSYLRWEFSETWKFKVPEPKTWDYIDELHQVPHFPINEYCWKTHESDNIIISSAFSRSAGGGTGIPLVFIPSAESDRLLIQYSILVRQFTISEKEYGFWNDIQGIGEAGSDIFGRQPWTIHGNIHSIDGSDDIVLGYFQTAAVTEKRIFIRVLDLVPLKLPYYHYECARLPKSPSDFKYPITFDEIYAMYCITSDWVFVEPLRDATGQVLYKIVFTRPECADCTVTGSKEKPEFWVDLDIQDSRHEEIQY